MKKVFMNLCLCFILFSLFSSQCVKIRNEYTLDLINNSDHNIGYYFTTGGRYGTHFPDTLLPNTNDWVLYDYSKVNSPGLLIRQEWKVYFSSLPKDTLSVFIFHTDTLNKYTWEEVRDRYLILKRYDLSLDDLMKLKNDYSVPEITYPPDERMKGMKMYPPYGSK